MAAPEPSADYRLVEVELDQTTLAATNPDSEYERRIAIYDLLEENFFRPEKCGPGPFKLFLSTADQMLSFSVMDSDNVQLRLFMLSLMPFRKIIKDYSFICTSYYEAIKTAPPSRIETIDMSRRALHMEAAQLLIDRLEGKIAIDMETSRRLFTLIFALHQRQNL